MYILLLTQIIHGTFIWLVSYQLFISKKLLIGLFFYVFRWIAMAFLSALPSNWSSSFSGLGPYFSVRQRPQCRGYTCSELVFVPFCLFSCSPSGCSTEFEYLTKDAEGFNTTILFNTQIVWLTHFCLFTTSPFSLWKSITCLHSKYFFSNTQCSSLRRNVTLWNW